MKLNLNIPCKITLTEEGARLWNAQYDIMPPECRPTPKTAGTKVMTQLWCVMEAFGPHIHIGMGDVYFEGNDIEFDDFGAN